MPIDTWWATPIYRDRITGVDFDALVDACQRLRERDASGRAQCKRMAGVWDFYGYTSAWSIPNVIPTDPLFADLFDRVHDHVRRFGDALAASFEQYRSNYESAGLTPFVDRTMFFARSIEFAQVFVNINSKGASHGRHIHKGSFVSGTVYLNSVGPPIAFHDPRVRALGELPVWYPVEQGTVLLWPGWLEHQVAQNTSDEEKISISFNTRAV